jgi:glycosyltransferase involved in cell wall biosynthesis
MIGPSFKAQGGISDLLTSYKKGFKKIKPIFIPTYSGTNIFDNVYYFVSAIIRVLIVCLHQENTIFHIHSSQQGSYLRKSIIAETCLFFKRKVVFHIHGSGFNGFLERSNRYKRNRIIKLLNRVDRVIICSKSIINIYKRYVPINKISVLYNPYIYTDDIYKVRNNKNVHILFIGRFGKRKGTYDLINTIEDIKDDGFKLFMFGDGEVKNVNNLIINRQLGNKILVFGWTQYDRIIRFIERADLLVLPSYAEQMPMTIIMAMAKGLPIISTKIAGIVEEVIDGVNGYLINPGDTKTLKEKILILINDKRKRQKMGKKSLAIAHARFSPKIIESKLIQIYEEVITGK